MELDLLSMSPLDFNQLNEQVYNLLKAEIVKGNLSPGQRLTVSAVANRLGVSPTPVRDALRRLSTDGLAEMIPRRGTFVSEFSKRSVREIFQIRSIIECASVERLAKASEEIIQHMEDIVERMDSLREGENFPDYASYIALDKEFHQSIVGLLENQRLNELYERLRWPIQVVRGLSYSDYQRAKVTVAEHAAIVQAFQGKNVSKAKAAILDHLNNAEADLLSRMPPEK